MRQHFKNGSGLCSHTTPEGRSIMGKFDRLKKKFNLGIISEEELRAYSLMLHSYKKDAFTVNGEVSFDIPETRETFRTIRVWGREIQVSIEEHKKHCLTYV